MLFLEQVRMISILCLSVFGCAGNLLTLLVVNRSFFRKTASAAFISGLSIADCFVLCLHSLQIVGKLRPQVTSYDCIVFYLMDVFRLLSVWIVCFINLERCSLVFNPCHMPRLTSRTKSRIFVMILFILSLMIFSHYGKHMNIEYVIAVNGTKPTRSICAYRPGFRRLLWESIRSALTYWTTVPLCIICNIIIIQRFYQASRIERNLQNQSSNKLYLSSKQRQLTAMLVGSSLCFVFTATPSTIHTIYLQITNNLSNHQYTIHIFTNILLHLHHSLNFLVFMFTCARFRSELIDSLRIVIRCEIYAHWSKRSTAATEQYIVNSNKNNKIPMKLLSTKANGHRCTNHQQNFNGIILLGSNVYPKRTTRFHRQTMQPYAR